MFELLRDNYSEQMCKDAKKACIFDGFVRVLSVTHFIGGADISGLFHALYFPDVAQ